MIYLDLDDFYDGNASWNMLSDLHSRIPSFKITLFTIPGRCSPAFLRWAFKHSWMDLVPHGWMHHTNYECTRWTYEDMRAYIAEYQRLGFTTKGFKAPGWQISNGCYQALLDSGYWVADQPYNANRRPSGLPAYLLGDHSIHGHVGHLNGHNSNALELIFDSILAKKNAEFGFIRDLMEEEALRIWRSA